MYKESKEPFEFDKFRAPAKEYRGAPFWAWTGRPDKNEMELQIAEFREMGFGGFFIHSRVGLDVEYLGREFMEDILFCRDTAEQLDLLPCLYDEDKWPSGFGGGRVTKTGEYASRYLLLSPRRYPTGTVRRQAPGHTRLSDSGDLSLLKCFALKLDNGHLEAFYDLPPEEEPGRQPREDFEIWYLYLVISEKLDWFNGERYADLLNSKTAARLLEVTYEQYYKVLGDDFGARVPAIFMDEPSVKRFEMMPDSLSPSEVGIPYSEDVAALWRERYGDDFLSHVPEIVFDCSDGSHYESRYRYFESCSYLFSTQFVGRIQQWCSERNISLTGHFQDENSLELQSKACGDVMRAMAKLDIPGVDILFNSLELFTLKQAQSVCRQLGKTVQSAELYGCTNWDFDFRGHKQQGDFAAVLGTTMRIPHLAWMSMKGEMKRDFPASINHFSPWYKKYKLLEDHFARVSSAMSRGKALVHIAVVDPVESMWLFMGPDNTNDVSRSLLERQFAGLCEHLLFTQFDFDLINEATLKDTACVSGASLAVGSMVYRTVILPGLVTLREHTLQLLLRFAEAGGAVISLGDPPVFIDGSADARYSASLQLLREKCSIIASHDLEALDNLLKPEKEINIDGSDSLLYHYREDADSRWLFIAHGRQPSRPFEDISLHIAGTYTPELYDTASGEVSPLAYTFRAGCTDISHRLYADDSLLIRLFPRTGELPASSQSADLQDTADYLPIAVPAEAALTLEEQNVLLLDMPCFSVDGADPEGPLEILRADDVIRRKTGYILRTEATLQPWLDPVRTCLHEVELFYTFSSELETEAKLAVEMEQGWLVALNDEPVSFTEKNAYYLDPSIRLSEKIRIKKGRNALRIKLPYGEKTNLERVYLLGSFGVFRSDSASEPFIDAVQGKVSFQDISEQGYLFYGGSVTYDFDVSLPAGKVKITVPKFAGALLELQFDGRSKDLYKLPFEAEFESREAGSHHVSIKVYGNRFNTFGAVHDCSGNRWCFGPRSFRTQGDSWTDHYCLRKFGLLSPLQIECSEI